MSKQAKRIITGLIIAIGIIGISRYVTYSFYQSEQKVKQVANKVIEEKDKSVNKKDEPKKQEKKVETVKDEQKKVEPEKENRPIKEIKNTTPRKKVKKEVKNITPSKEVNTDINKAQSIISEIYNPESDIFCVIDVPSIGINKLPVRCGVGDEKEQLVKGGSLLPNAPEPPEPASNAVIGAYKNVTGHDYFRNIDSIKQGDELTLYVYGDTYKYKCKEKFIVNQNEYNKISKNLGCTAITLYSINSADGVNATQRHVVRFELGD